MRECAQTEAMRRGLLNVITVGHVIKSEEGQACFLDLCRLVHLWLKGIGGSVGGRESVGVFVCLSVCLCVPGGFQTDLAKI